MSLTRREHCAPIIAEVIRRVGRDDMKALRRALREAYPYGERNYWPYKAWCAEVRNQLAGAKPAANRLMRRADDGVQRDLLAEAARR